MPLLLVKVFDSAFCVWQKSWKFDQYTSSTAHSPLVKIRHRLILSRRSWIYRQHNRKESDAMKFLLSCCIVAVVACSVAATSHGYSSRPRGRCEPVPHFCQNLTNSDSYSHMRLPNAFNNYKLAETVQAMMPWTPLVGLCHSGLKLFLCAIYAPICLFDSESGEHVSIKLCKSFCNSVKKSCEPVMGRHNYSWPTHFAFNCSGYQDDTMCVREDFVSTPKPPPVIDSICDPDLNETALSKKTCKRDLVIRAEVLNVRNAKGDNSYKVIKIKRHKKLGRQGARSQRKTKKAVESLDRVLLPKRDCPNVKERVKKGVTYLIILNKRSGRKTKYIVKAIVPWRSKLHKKFMRPKSSKSRKQSCR